MAEVWAKELGCRSVGREDSFFELGGDSLRVISVINQLRRTFRCSVNNLYEHPRLWEFAATCRHRPDHLRSQLRSAARSWQGYRLGIGGYEREREEALSSAFRDYEARNRRYEGGGALDRRDYRRVLLTGATGYLGSYLLRELLADPEREVSALVRGEDSETARLRLGEVLCHYFGPQEGDALRDDPRLQVLAGDLRRDDLGLSSKVREDLATKTQAVFHCAANVKHFGHLWEFEADNVAATGRLLRLAGEAASPADFHLVSTLSVCGEPPESGFRLFTEYDPVPARPDENYYLRSKQGAEKLVVEARRVLANACIHRVGNLVFDAEGGPLQRNLGENAFFRLVGAFLGLGVVPDDSHLWLCHVDVVARGLLLLAGSADLCNETHHLENARRDRLASFVGEVAGVRTCGFDGLLARLLEAVDEPDLGAPLAEVMEKLDLYRGERPNPARGGWRSPRCARRRSWRSGVSPGRPRRPPGSASSCARRCSSSRGGKKRSPARSRPTAPRRRRHAERAARDAPRLAGAKTAHGPRSRAWDHDPMNKGAARHGSFIRLCQAMARRRQRRAAEGKRRAERSASGSSAAPQEGPGDRPPLKTYLSRFGILSFLERETHALDEKLIVLTVVSGIANAMNLAVINAAVDALRGGGPPWEYFAWFGLSIGLFVYSFRYILYESTRITEDAICSVRLRLADKIRRSDLLALESIGAGDIHARIGRDTAAIAQAARPLFAAAQGVVMILFTLGYIALVSRVAVVLCLLLIAAGGVKWLRDRKVYERGLQDASTHEDELSESLNGLLLGFKELRINQQKSDDVFDEFQRTATRVREVRTRVMVLFSNNLIFVEMFFVLLLGAVAFVLPVLATAFTSSATKIVAAILFFFGPLTNVVMLFPMLAQVNVTVDNLERLEATLDENLARSPERLPPSPVDLSTFGAIRLEGVHFAYKDSDGSVTFQVGPIDGEVKRGEVLFLIGGNGSGKTTFLKLLTALYWPSQGRICVDGVEIGPTTAQSYRGLFSAIFSDFHLFEKLHGLSKVAPERVSALLEVMGLSKKTALDRGRFTTTHLSTGQRKRLALVVACLEEKLVYVFDEVAADQDAHFRGYFYETLLPELKGKGKTVVVVTHDERYFHVADRVLGMDYGKLRVESTEAT